MSHKNCQVGFEENRDYAKSKMLPMYSRVHGQENRLLNTRVSNGAREFLIFAQRP